MTPLPNPERGWSKLDSAEPGQEQPASQAGERPSLVGAADVTDVVLRRLGPTSEPLEVLSGGLANLNVAVGDAQVLRVYRRDPRDLQKEASLLRRAWRSVRVPAVLRQGDDFLLLERVAHGPLLTTAAHGAAVGRALAEVHETRFASAGLLGGDLTVVEPFRDAVSALCAHVDDQLAGPAGALLGELAAPLRAFLAEHANGLREHSRRAVLLHGDFKASNLHWTHDDRLLVLDWEFAWAGPALMDVGQLVRWSPTRTFCDAFAASYRAHGGDLPDDWARRAEQLDLANLVGLLASTHAGSRRAEDVRQRIARTIS